MVDDIVPMSASRQRLPNGGQVEMRDAELTEVVNQPCRIRKCKVCVHLQPIGGDHPRRTGVCWLGARFHRLSVATRLSQRQSAAASLACESVSWIGGSRYQAGMQSTYSNPVRRTAGSSPSQVAQHDSIPWRGRRGRGRGRLESSRSAFEVFGGG